MVDIKKDDLEPLTNDDVEAEWKKRFPSHNALEYTTDIKRGLLEMIERRPEMEQKLIEALEAREFLERHHEEFRVNKLLMREWGVLD